MGDLDLPYEEVPDGPIEMDVNVVVCSGVTVRGAMVPHPSDPGLRLPALVFDFYTASGEKLAPILFTQPTRSVVDGGLFHLRELVHKAVRSTVRLTREHNRG